MKVLITGKTGQVGSALLSTVPKNIEVFAYDRYELDITSFEILNNKIRDIKPEYIINTAAYTSVDKAENDFDVANLVNSTAVANISDVAKDISAKLFHLSTDYVFNGNQNTPYLPSDNKDPVSVYGKTKSIGEDYIRKKYASGSIILRSSWIYSTTGNNFVKTMLNLMKERNELRVVIDQIGTPTWAKNLALTIWIMINNNTTPGIYHWTDSGIASWYDFANAIYIEAKNIKLLAKDTKIIPVRSNQLTNQFSANRPSYSVLDTSETNKIWGIQNEHWQNALKKMLIEQKSLLKITRNIIK